MTQLKNKRILFVVPPITMTEVFGEMAEAGNILPFQGILSLAALTRDRGYDTYFVDAFAEKLSQQEVSGRLKEIKPDYVGLTATTLVIPKAALIASLAKKEFPNCKTIVGGPHFTAVPGETMKVYSDFDFGVIGEGEETLLELLSFLDSGRKDYDRIKGVVYRTEDGQITETPFRDLIQDLDQYPLPAWDLLPELKKYYIPSPENINRLPAVSLIVTRGCPMQCTFCFNSVDSRNRIPRWYSTEKIIELIDNLVDQHGIKEISFLDDNLLANRKKLRELCEALIEKKYDLTWSCLGSCNFADEELFRLMKKAGCWQISWGIKHACQEILDVYNKGIKVEQMVEGVKLAKKCGLVNRAFIMHGNFLETKETIEKNIDYLLKLPVSEFHAGFFIPLPGTIAYHQVEKYGRWNNGDNSWEAYGLFDKPIFIPKGLSEEILIKTLNQMYRRFYLRPKIVFYYVSKMIRHPSTFKRLLVTGLTFLKVYLK